MQPIPMPPASFFASLKQPQWVKDLGQVTLPLSLSLLLPKVRVLPFSSFVPVANLHLSLRLSLSHIFRPTSSHTSNPPTGKPQVANPAPSDDPQAAPSHPPSGLPGVRHAAERPGGGGATP
jgi:hypothetical protein